MVKKFNTFRVAVIVLAIGCAIIPSVFIAVPLLLQLHDQAYYGATRDLRARAELMAERTADIVADLKAEAFSIATNEEIQRATQSILFVEAASARLHRFSTANDLVGSVVLFGGDLSGRAASPVSALATTINEVVLDAARKMINADVSDGNPIFVVADEDIHVIIPVRGLYNVPVGILLVAVDGEKLLQMVAGSAEPISMARIDLDGKPVIPSQLSNATEPLLSASSERPIDEKRVDGPKIRLTVLEEEEKSFGQVRRYTWGVGRNVFGILLFSGLAGFLFAWVTRGKRQERARLEAQLNALRSQMNPHFLFNALNSIASLVQVDGSKASQMTTNLADLYRSIVGASKSKTVPLSEELKLVQTYLDLEKVRFDERLEYEIKVDVDPKLVTIPGLILLTLVENAVKHGIAALRAGGVVSVNVSDVEKKGWVRVEVSNSTPKTSTTPESAPGTATGLINTRERLDLIYGDAHRFQIRRTDDLFVVEFYIPGGT